MAAPEMRDGWVPDPFGRYDERFFVYGEPSRLVRTGGVEATDPYGTEPSPRAESPVTPVAPVAPPTPTAPPARDAHVEPIDPRLGAAPRRLAGWGWAVFAALCATGALIFATAPLIGAAVAFALLAVLGVVRFGVALWAERRTRRAPAPRLPTVDLYDGTNGPSADGLSVSDELDRLVEVEGVERVS